MVWKFSLWTFSGFIHFIMPHTSVMFRILVTWKLHSKCLSLLNRLSNWWLSCLLLVKICCQYLSRLDLSLIAISYLKSTAICSLKFVPVYFLLVFNVDDVILLKSIDKLQQNIYQLLQSWVLSWMKISTCLKNWKPYKFEHSLKRLVSWIELIT